MQASATLSQISRYPLKSCRAQNLSNARVTQLGIEGDRRLVLAELDGRFITARTEPLLLGLELDLRPNGWQVRHAEHPHTETCLVDACSSELGKVSIWNRQLSAPRLIASEAWFSQLLKRPVQLLHNGEAAADLADKRYPWGPIFSDGYPLLVTNSASLDALNSASGAAFEVARFRPNLVIESDTPWAEDSWDLIRIGEVLLRREKPCERCVLITRDPITGEKDPQQEPLRTLNQLGRNQDGAILFGQNYSVIKPGTLRQGDAVEFEALL